MDDLLLSITQDPDTKVNYMDIDIVDGYALYVPDPGDVNTTQQRAAVAALLSKSTIPGREDIGADWGGYISKTLSLLDVDNQVKENIERYAGGSTMTNMPIPVYAQNEQGGMDLSILGISPTITNVSGT